LRELVGGFDLGFFFFFFSFGFGFGPVSSRVGGVWLWVGGWGGEKGVCGFYHIVIYMPWQRVLLLELLLVEEPWERGRKANEGEKRRRF
jgi:hypothetical protein